jgi:DNA helicase-2/ATP-dependent DNA helicase PcrA
MIKEVLRYNLTQVYCIGDPLQSIFKFTYAKSQIRNEPKPKSFDETPLMDFAKSFPDSVLKIVDNHRSSPEIVKFINHFNKEVEQKAVKKATNIPVYFIGELDKFKIVEAFYNLISEHRILEGNVKLQSLLLSREWSLFEEIATKFDLSRISKDNHKISSQLQEISRCILGLTGLKKSEVLKITDELTYRKFCLTILRFIKTKSFNDSIHRANTIIKLFKERFRYSLDNIPRNRIDVNNSLDQLALIAYNPLSSHFYSSIHSAKGLEATSVLVCANTTNQLKKWLEAEEHKIKSMDDGFRLGYVAFSRARKLLCISCLQEITKSLKEKLIAFNIRYFSNGQPAI